MAGRQIAVVHVGKLRGFSNLFLYASAANGRGGSPRRDSNEAWLYTLPAGLIVTYEILEALGEEDDSEVTVDLRIAQADKAETEGAQAAAEADCHGGWPEIIVGSPESARNRRSICWLCYTNDLSAGGSFAESALTAVVVEADGSIRHVSTKVELVPIYGGQ